MSSSNSVLSRVRMFEQHQVANAGVPTSNNNSPKSNVTKILTSLKTSSPETQAPSAVSRLQKDLSANGKPFCSSSAEIYENTSMAGTELVGWPSIDDDEGIPTPTNTSWKRDAKTSKLSVTSRYQQALPNPKMRSPLAVTKSFNGWHRNSATEWPSQGAEEAVRSPKAVSESGEMVSIQVNEGSRMARLPMAMSSSGVTSPVARRSPLASSGDELVGWPSAEEENISPENVQHPCNSSPWPSVYQAHSDVEGRSPNSLPTEEISSWPAAVPEKQTRESAISPSSNSVSATFERRSGGGSVESTNPIKLQVSEGSISAIDSPQDDGSPTSIGWPTHDSLANTASHSVFSGEDRWGESVLSRGESTIDRLQTTIVHSASNASESSSQAALKQSLGDAAVVLREERLSSVGSASSSRRSSLSTSELSSIVKKALQAAASDEGLEQRPPSTITTKSKNSTRNLQAVSARARAKAYLSFSASLDDSATASSSRTTDSSTSGIEKAAEATTKTPLIRPPPLRQERPASIKTKSHRRELPPSKSDDGSIASEITSSSRTSRRSVFSAAQRRLTMRQGRRNESAGVAAPAPSLSIPRHESTAESDDASIASEKTSSSRTSRRSAFSAAQRRLTTRKGHGNESSGVGTTSPSPSIPRHESTSSEQRAKTMLVCQARAIEVPAAKYVSKVDKGVKKPASLNEEKVQEATAVVSYNQQSLKEDHTRNVFAKRTTVALTPRHVNAPQEHTTLTSVASRDDAIVTTAEQNQNAKEDVDGAIFSIDEHETEEAVIKEQVRESSTGSRQISAVSQMSLASRKDSLKKKFSAHLKKTDSVRDDAIAADDELKVSVTKPNRFPLQGRISDHPAYRFRQSSTPERLNLPPTEVSSSGVDDIGPQSTAIEAASIATGASDATSSLGTAWEVQKLSSSATESSNGEATRCHHVTREAFDTFPFSETNRADFGVSFAIESSAKAGIDHAKSSLEGTNHQDEAKEGSNTGVVDRRPDESSTLIGQAYVRSSSEDTSQTEPIVDDGRPDEPRSYLPASQRIETNGPIQNKSHDACQFATVRWWQKTGERTGDNINVAISESSSSSTLLSNATRHTFSGVDESDRSSRPNDGPTDKIENASDEATSPPTMMAERSAVSASVDHFGATLDRAKLQTVHSDITSSILAGEATNDVVKSPRVGASNALGDETTSNEEESLVMTIDQTLKVQERNNSARLPSEHSKGPSSPGVLSPSIFMKFGFGVLESLTTGICGPPGMPADDLVLSPDSRESCAHDEQGSIAGSNHDAILDEIYAAEPTENPGALHDEYDEAALARTFSDASAASVTQATMNEKEKEMWNEWDKRETKSRSKSSLRSSSSAMTSVPDEPSANLSRPTIRNGPQLPLESPRSRKLLDKETKSNKLPPTTPLTHNQLRILEKFSATLKNHGIEVLKLNRDNKWQRRYLTVSKEIHFLNAGESNRLSGDRGQCPLGILWLKRFSVGRNYSVESIHDGRGGLLLSHLSKVSASSHSDSGYPLTNKKHHKFKDSVPVHVVCSDRSLVFRCVTTDEAHFLCTGLRVVMDVLRRECEVVYDRHGESSVNAGVLQEM